jgi:hypothetical protein
MCVMAIFAKSHAGFSPIVPMVQSVARIFAILDVEMTLTALALPRFASTKCALRVVARIETVRDLIRFAMPTPTSASKAAGMTVIVLGLGSFATMRTRNVSRDAEMILTALVPRHAAKMSAVIEPRQEMTLARESGLI